MKTKLLFESKKSKESSGFFVTIFTPTFNRKDTIVRTYQSILQLKVVSGGIDWIIVDDGSSDGTEELGCQWCEENKLSIRYFKQENQGKHVAMNFATQQARGKFWLTIDSDDTILPDALLKYSEAWNSIPEKKRNEYCGVSARCVDSEGNIVGDRLPY